MTLSLIEYLLTNNEYFKNIDMSLSIFLDGLFQNKNISLKFKIPYLTKPRYLYIISEIASYEDFINNQDLEWYYNVLSYNKNIPFEYIKNNLYDNTNVNFYKKWSWDWISERVTYDEFINNQDLPWDYKKLSCNENIPFEYIKNNLYKPWNWSGISSRGIVWQKKKTKCRRFTRC